MKLNCGTPFTWNSSGIEMPSRSVFTPLSLLIAMIHATAIAHGADLNLRGHVPESREVQVEVNSTGEALLIRSASNSPGPVKLKVHSGRAPASVSVLNGGIGGALSETSISVPRNSEGTRVMIGIEAP